MLAEKTQKLENVAQSLRERTWWAYDSFGVVYGDWRITIDRKPNVYRPFLFSVAGVKKRRTLASPRVTCNRRYQSIDAALLHIFNEFSDGSSAEKRFHTLDEAISTVCTAVDKSAQAQENASPAPAAYDTGEGPAWWRMREVN